MLQLTCVGAFYKSVCEPFFQCRFLCFPKNCKGSLFVREKPACFQYVDMLLVLFFFFSDKGDMTFFLAFQFSLLINLKRDDFVKNAIASLGNKLVNYLDLGGNRGE